VVDMKNKKSFHVFFHLLSNTELTKDVGMIPFMLSYHQYYSPCVIVSYNNSTYSRFYSCLKPLSTLELVLLDGKSNYKLTSVPLKQFYYLLKHAKDIDILQLYHLHQGSLFLGAVYKIMNRKGFLYIKFDSDGSYSEDIPIWKRVGRTPIFKTFCYIADLITIETPEALQNTVGKFGFFKKKLKLLPNGFGGKIAEKLGFSTVDFEKKQKKIITVGRLGTTQKATEILIQAFERIANSIPEWSLILIGPIENNLKKYAEEFYKRRPELKSRVLFTGKIDDLKMLYTFYAESSIFCLPSRHEGSAHVLVEAAFFGNAIITTDIGGARYVLDNGKIGEIIPKDNPDALAKSIEKIVRDDTLRLHYQRSIRKRCLEIFTWERITQQLYQYITSIQTAYEYEKNAKK
jgi:glycosyltransferase involved in cell wall biosynthesis